MQVNEMINEKNEQDLLKRGGTCKVVTESDHIYIERVNANKKGNGYGTAVMREAVSNSFKYGFSGFVTTDATYSSHLFHLYMGMIPQKKDEKIDYIDVKWGWMAAAAFKKINRKVPSPLASDESEILYRILREAKGLPVDAILTTADLLDKGNIGLIISMKNHHSDYIQNELVPQLLRTLSRYEPETINWGGVPMVLSDVGKLRWKEALDQNLEFRLFKNFEHLHPYMTEDQISQLNVLIEQRAAVKDVFENHGSSSVIDPEEEDWRDILLSDELENIKEEIISQFKNNPSNAAKFITALSLKPCLAKKINDALQLNLADSQLAMPSALNTEVDHYMYKTNKPSKLFQELKSRFNANKNQVEDGTDNKPALNT